MRSVIDLCVDFYDSLLHADRCTQYRTKRAKPLFIRVIGLTGCFKNGSVRIIADGDVGGDHHEDVETAEEFTPCRDLTWPISVAKMPVYLNF